MIISCESIDAGGKGVQAEALRTHFAPLFRTVEVMHFPVYDSVTGRLILKMLKGERQISREAYGQQTKDEADQALALQCAMATNRLEHFAKLARYVEPGNRYEFAAQNLLVLDRYNESAIAYGLADGLDYDFLKKIHEALPKPAHRFLIDITVEESFRRRPERADAYEANRERLERTRECYLRVFRDGAGQGYHVVDGMREPGEITKEIVHIIAGGK